MLEWLQDPLVNGKLRLFVPAPSCCTLSHCKEPFLQALQHIVPEESSLVGLVSINLVLKMDEDFALLFPVTSGLQKAKGESQF